MTTVLIATQFYNDDQDSEGSYSLLIISKTGIKDNSESHFLKLALVFVKVTDEGFDLKSL